LNLARTNFEWVAQVSLLRPGFLLAKVSKPEHPLKAWRKSAPDFLLRTAYLDLRAKTNSKISTTTRNAFKTSSIGSICCSLLCCGGAFGATLGGCAGGTASAGTCGAKAGAGGAGTCGGAKTGAGGAGTGGAAKAGTGAAGKTSVGGTGMAKFPAATPDPAAAPGSAADAGLIAPPPMMRVNSPGPAKPAGAAACCIGGVEPTACCRSSVSLWINMVTLAG
jgi:hypothetical protein